MLLFCQSQTYLYELFPFIYTINEYNVAFMWRLHFLTSVHILLELSNPNIIWKWY